MMIEKRKVRSTTGQTTFVVHPFKLHRLSKMGSLLTCGIILLSCVTLAAGRTFKECQEKLLKLLDRPVTPTGAIPIGEDPISVEGQWAVISTLLDDVQNLPKKSHPTQTGTAETQLAKLEEKSDELFGKAFGRANNLNRFRLSMKEVLNPRGMAVNAGVAYTVTLVEAIATSSAFDENKFLFTFATDMTLTTCCIQILNQMAHNPKFEEETQKFVRNACETLTRTVAKCSTRTRDCTTKCCKQAVRGGNKFWTWFSSMVTDYANTVNTVFYADGNTP